MRSRRKPTSKVKELGSGIHDLPAEVAVVVEENLAQSLAADPAPVPSTATVPELVERLTAIRERIWRLRSVYAVTLSQDTAVEANQYVDLFQSLAAELRVRDADALEALTRGHESTLLSPPVTVRPTIPLAAQMWCEMKWLAQRQPEEPGRNIGPDTIHDGMGQFL